MSYPAWLHILPTSLGTSKCPAITISLWDSINGGFPYVFIDKVLFDRFNNKPVAHQYYSLDH